MSFDYFSKDRVEYILSKLKTIIDKKQDILTAGDNVVIDNNVISASVDVDNIIDDLEISETKGLSSSFIMELLESKMTVGSIVFADDSELEVELINLFNLNGKKV